MHRQCSHYRLDQGPDSRLQTPCYFGLKSPRNRSYLSSFRCIVNSALLIPIIRSCESWFILQSSSKSETFGSWSEPIAIDLLPISVSQFTEMVSVQISAKRCGCLLSYSQAELGRELTQPRKHLLAEPCRVHIHLDYRACK